MQIDYPKMVWSKLKKCNKGGVHIIFNTKFFKRLTNNKKKFENKKIGEWR